MFGVHGFYQCVYGTFVSKLHSNGHEWDRRIACQDTPCAIGVRSCKLYVFVTRAAALVQLPASHMARFVQHVLR